MSYSPSVIDYFSRMPGGGELPGATLRGEAGSAETGTWVIFQARLRGGEIAEMGFRAYGCPDTIAAAGYTVEQLSGGPVQEVAAWRPDQVADDLEIPREKIAKLLIMEDALRECFRDWDTSTAPVDKD